MDTNPCPALLARGFHVMNLSELRALCVDRFAASSRRGSMMLNLETLVEGLRKVGISGKLWIDGSFLTEKIEPNDVDLVLELDNNFWESLNPNQQSDVKWLEANSEIRTEYGCDAHILVQWPMGHPSYSHGEWLRAFYIKLFGWVEFFEMKGIAVIVL